MSLFAFGLGFCAERAIARGRLGPAAGTVRRAELVERWRRLGVEAYAFHSEDIPAALGRARVALVSIPPDARGDPTLQAFGPALRRAGLQRVVYLSTVGVYGDTGGGWVDETGPTAEGSARQRGRLAAEAAWARFGAEAGVAVDVLRLGGIYGPGRSAFDKLRDGTARNIVKAGQVFNRIHVDDVAAAVEAVVAAGAAGDIYNAVDGAPSSPEEPLVYAAQKLGVAAPPPEPFETAAMSEMARSFYEANRRIRPDKLMRLGWKPAYPSYREGLDSIYSMKTIV